MERFALINKWLDIINEDLWFDKEVDIDIVRNQIKKIDNNFVFFELMYRNEAIGCLGYMIYSDLTGRIICNNVVMYLLPDHRKDKYFDFMINAQEEEAKTQFCTILNIGGSIGYRDEVFLRKLKQKGYITNVVQKRIGE